MKRLADTIKQKLTQREMAQVHRRGGAALIIVLAMTGMLMFLGFFFFSYISAERNSAAWFALSANREINDGDYFDFALQQVLIGPTDDLRNSALYGRKWSMIPNMLGSFGPDLKPNDLHPYSGRGVNVIFQEDVNGLPNDTSADNDLFRFDYNGDGTPDRRVLNFSPAANPVSNVPRSPLGDNSHPAFVPDFEPDAGYTYPDINSMFLGHFSLIEDPADPTGPLKKVWIPSFHRPQYLPRNGTTNLYTDNTYQNRVLRPHRENRVRMRFYNGTEIETQHVLRYPPAGGFASFTGTTGPAEPFPTPGTTTPNHHTGIWQDIDDDDLMNYDASPSGELLRFHPNVPGNEAILLDLDHRVETLADGTKRIPIYAITIMDADGLLNLNVAGNLFGEEIGLAHIANPSGQPRFITQSNLGLSPSELNLGRALYRPLSTTPDGSYNSMFGSLPTLQTTMANAEVTRLLLGYADGNVSTTNELVAGRLGEVNLLDQAVAGGQPPLPPFPRTSWAGAPFPAPGQVNLDDNNNYGTGAGKAQLAGTYNQDPIFGPMNIGIPSGVHPIDPMGVASRIINPGQVYSDSFVTANRDLAVLTDTVFGGSTPTNNPYGKLRMGHKLPDNPSKWINYTDRWELQADPSIVSNMYAQAGVRPWFQGANSTGALQATQSHGALNYFLADEPDEIVVEPAFRNLDFDSLFSVSEMQFLHMSDTDVSSTGIGTESRLAKLVNFNFGQTDIRSQFTTDSWDRWEFGFAPAIGTQRQWEFTDYTIQVDGQDKVVWVFPPEFDGAERTLVDLNPYNPTFRGATHRNDPFRPELYEWIRTVRDPQKALKNPLRVQRRLNINRILDRDNTGKVIERHLTPHPVFAAGDTDSSGILDMMYGDTNSVVRLYDTIGYDTQLLPLPGSVAFNNMQGNKFVQEWWAKYDRQRLARDIYVLLYTLGAGNHNNNPTTNSTALSASGDPAEHQARCREMAQFAVNYVDALDRDSVITEFVYDTNLSDGWNITGEKDSSGLLVEHISSGGQADRVFGVETQQLTFSEILWTEFTAESDGNDSTSTSWDDATAIQFLFVELRNASPFDVSYSTDSWRLRIDTGNPNTDPWIAFQTNTALQQIESGAAIWIGTHNHDDDAVPAAIMVDGDDNGTIESTEVYCPSRQQVSNDGTDPVCHLDLCHSNHTDRFYTGEGRDGNRNPSAPNTGFLLSHTPQIFAAGTPLKLVLERRLNTYGNGALENNLANSWVVVDEMQYEPESGPLELLDSTGGLDITKLDDARSIERAQPLSRWNENNYSDRDTSTHRSHSFGPKTPLTFNDSAYDPYVAANDKTPEVNSQKTFTLWQPHFDRDFTSVFELLSIPLTGPDKLSQSEEDPVIMDPPRGISANNKLSGLNTAYTKFAIPDLGAAVPEHKNNWYRILEFLEVPTSVQSGIRDKLPIPRTPGKINLNTIRHPGVLAALIDDDYHLKNFEDSGIGTGERVPYNQLLDPHEANRHWYEQFLYSRDRVDPITDLPLPGIPGSRPFRPLSFVDTTGTRNANASVEHTILRSLPFTEGVTPMTENNSPTGLAGTSWTAADLQTGLEQSLQRRGLFEARTNLDAGFMGTSVDAVDFHSRHRLLNKIANNTTVRSHLFYCWIQVQFHEAAEDEFGNAQVGGPLDTTDHPVKRAFFVIDRSKLEEAWDPRSKTFDWRKFVIFRKVLQ